MSINKVILVGRVGANPELRYFDEGNCVAHVRLATNEWYRDKRGQMHQMTEWHRLVLWNRLAESAEKFLQKGSLIYVEGRLTYRTWEDRGKQIHRSAEVHVLRIQYLDSRMQSQNSSDPKSAENQQIDGALGDEPILPF